FPEELPSESVQGNTQSWFDLFDPTQDERASVERATGLKLPTREQLSDVESRERRQRRALSERARRNAHRQRGRDALAGRIRALAARTRHHPLCTPAFLRPGDREASPGWQGSNERRDIHASGRGD